MRISLFSIDPRGRGGMRTSALAVYHLLKGWKLQPTLCYVSNSLSEGMTPRELVNRRRLWDVREQTRLGMYGLAIGHVAAHFPSLVYNWWPYSMVRRYLQKCSMHIVLGAPICGITLAVLHKPYICWSSTLLSDELAARARGGEEEARRLLRSPGWPLMVWQERLVLRRATHILAISHYTASRIRKEVPEVSDKVQVLSYPIDTDEFHPSATHSSRWREFAGWTLISVGRLDDPRKNIPALLKALPLVQEKIGKIRLKLIGSGAESVTSYIEEMKLGSIVECLGHVPKTRLVQELQSSDLFILPSRQEGLGLVVLEAMACGLAVVSTRCGGPEKHVRDGETGYLVAQNDHKAIAAGIIQALQDPDKLLEMGIYARQLVLQNNSYAGVETQLRTVLGEVYPEFMPWMAEARNHADSYS